MQLVTEIVHITNYVYLINRSCRLDSTLSIVVIIFVLHTLSWCQIVVRIKLLPRPYKHRTLNAEIFTVIQTHTYTAFQEVLKYSDFFRDHLPQHIGDVRREFIFYGLEMGLEKADLDRTTSTCTTELNIRYERTLVI